MLPKRIHEGISNLLGVRFIVGAVVGIALAAGVTFVVLRPSRADNASNLLRKEGFNFDVLRSPDNEWRGPEVGEQLDLNRFKGGNGETLASVVGNRPAMLVVVDPTCPMCKKAADEMKYVRDQLAPMSVAYYVTDFLPVDENFFRRYAAGLIEGAPAFLWPQDGAPPQYSFIRIAQPSHILVNFDGTVLRVWPGAHGAKEVRDRMGRQIVADTGVIVDTLRVLSEKPKPKDVEKKAPVSERASPR